MTAYRDWTNPICALRRMLTGPAPSRPSVRIGGIVDRALRTIKRGREHPKPTWGRDEDHDDD